MTSAKKGGAKIHPNGFDATEMIKSKKRHVLVGTHDCCCTVQGNRVNKTYLVTRLARNSSSQDAAFRRPRMDCLVSAPLSRLSAICLIVVKLAGA